LEGATGQSILSDDSLMAIVRCAFGIRTGCEGLRVRRKKAGYGGGGSTNFREAAAQLKSRGFDSYIDEHVHSLAFHSTSIEAKSDIVKNISVK